MPEKILVVEDEKDLSRVLRYNLEQEGYSVTTSRDAEAAMGLINSKKPDLVILDVMLPGMNGFDCCRQIREKSSVPILFLTAKKTEIDRILGLRLGADDYVTKPFSVGELMARVNSLLRRARRTQEKKDPENIRAGSLSVDFERREIKVKNKAVKLTPKEFRLLKTLIEANGKVLSREKLLETVWGYDQSIDIDTRTVDQHIARLRKKLAAEGKRLSTISNAGYQFKS